MELDKSLFVSYKQGLEFDKHSFELDMVLVVLERSLLDLVAVDKAGSLGYSLGAWEYKSVVSSDKFELVWSE